MEEQKEAHTISVDQPVMEANKKTFSFKWHLLLSLSVFIIGILAVAGWMTYKNFFVQPLSVEQPKKFYTEKVVIAYIPWPGYLGLYIARDKGYFKEAGVDVELRLYNDFNSVLEVYRTGEAQGRMNLTLDVGGGIGDVSNRINQKIVLATDYSNGADALIAKSTITTVEQLKGKRVAFEYGGLEEFFVRYVLEQYSLSLTDIIPVNLPPDKAAEALVKGQVDAAKTYEPFLTTTVNQIRANKLYTSADAPGLIADLLTFRSEFVDAYPDTVSAIVGAYFRGVAFWQTHPEEANKLLAKELGVTPEEVKAQLQGIKILDYQDNVSAFTVASGVQSLYGNLRQVGKFASNQKRKSIINTDQLIEPKFIKNLPQPL